MGNPNVGKSVIFSRLTGVDVIASNYPGTTVEYTRGYMRLGDEKVEVIDVPGTYTLEPTSKAEEVAVNMLQEGDLVIDIVDATNLERNLNLTLQLLNNGKPTVVALNLWDETRHIGISLTQRDWKKFWACRLSPPVPSPARASSNWFRGFPVLRHMRLNTTRKKDGKKWERS